MALSGLKLPAIAAPMFMVSCPDLVVEACRAGLLGSFPALNCRDAEGYAAWLVEIRARLDGEPFAVNLSLRKGSPRLEADLAATVAAKVPVVLTSLGISRDLVARIHDYGGIVLHDVTTVRHAEKAAEAGVDGLILVCAGAGGHGGALNPFAFLGEVRSWFSGTLALAGAISTGRDIAAARVMGADMVSIGTRFIATREANAPDAYKAMILAAHAADIAYTAAPTGVPASFLRPSLAEWGVDPEASDHPTLDTATRTLRHAGREGKVWRDLWSAGQGSGAIRDIPTTAELCARLIAEYRAVIPA
ncbi:nitronate monooxygenase family protein [Sphingomonas sp. AOB5]|uniref:NAD(P)H-dependent flavin oxidoreductase n=1 Tax=Sphingomonas sp. AOB5 TaxID=3034017 RepID=UPI0023F9A620|nr:nitronate monooxygenase family protein [Sphingomonas sp. AOB5]MDF7776716.1 nitronate monooxygenase family protein [Sphingomonas sp. AOB5]